MTPGGLCEENILEEGRAELPEGLEHRQRGGCKGGTTGGQTILWGFKVHDGVVPASVPADPQDVTADAPPDDDICLVFRRPFVLAGLAGPICCFILCTNTAAQHSLG